MRLSPDQLIQTIILGLIQGLAEWLPISSTAHLRIAEHFLNFAATPLFNVTLHAGTLVIVMFYFRRELASIFSALARWDFKSEHGRWIPLIMVAMVPTGIVGLVYVMSLEESFKTIPMIGATFIVGASIVYISRFGKEKEESMTYPMAIVAGLAQGFAIFPGLSRSGVVISSLLLLGLENEKAFRFSFLVSIPAILGDLVVEAYMQRGQFLTQGAGSLNLLVGPVLAIIAGYAAIRIVARLVTTKRFYYFAFYTWSLGAALILLSLAGF